MFRLFSSKKEEKGSTPREAIQKLRETETILLKKQEFLEKKIEDEVKIVKANGMKNKRLAIQALKKKRRYEKQLQQIDGTLTTLEMQREALEEAVSNVAVIETLKFGSESLKVAQKNYSVDHVHDIMDNIAEQLDVAREMSEAISTPLGFGEDISEEDLEHELEQLEQEALDDELIKLPNNLNLPTPVDESVERPSVKVPAKPSQDSDEHLLSELSSWST